MRLIDSEKLGLTDFEIVMCDGDYKEALKMVLGKIEDAPTVDAVEVVRCKDCRYCTTNTTVMTTQTLVHCNAHRIMTEWDGYCYKGERR